jgi:hypothetical protein
VNNISDGMYERLHQILETKRKNCTLQEAKEIGDGLLDFFILLIELDNEVDNSDDDEP